MTKIDSEVKLKPFFSHHVTHILQNTFFINSISRKVFLSFKLGLKINLINLGHKKVLNLRCNNKGLDFNYESSPFELPV